MARSVDRVDPHVTDADTVTPVFKFKLENRIVDDQSGQVRYSRHDESMLSLDLPDEIITNRDEYNAYKEAVAKAKAAKVRRSACPVAPVCLLV